MPGSDQQPRGPLVAIGGAEDKLRNQRILRRVAELAGGEQARICVIPTASRVADTGKRYQRVFRELGVDSVKLLKFQTRADGSDRKLLDCLQQSTGVFLTGGNQLRLSTIMGGTEAARMIRRRHAAGMMVAGTSAGAAIMSEHMIAFGEEGPTPRAGMVSLVPGFGLCNSVIIDQHFRQRDRLGRLLTALAYNPYAIGLGLDEDTAAIIDPENDIHVLGSSAVTVVDASELEHSGMGYVRRGQPVSLTGLRLHVLVDGGSFCMHSRTARPAQVTSEEIPEAQLVAADRDVRGDGRQITHRGADEPPR